MEIQCGLPAYTCLHPYGHRQTRERQTNKEARRRKDMFFHIFYLIKIHYLRTSTTQSFFLTPPASVCAVCSQGSSTALLHSQEPLPVPGVVHCHLLLLWVPYVPPNNAQYHVSWNAGMNTTDITHTHFTFALFPPGLNICCETSSHRWEVLTTGGKILRTHWGCIWDHIFRWEEWE